MQRADERGERTVEHLAAHQRARCLVGVERADRALQHVRAQCDAGQRDRGELCRMQPPRRSRHAPTVRVVRRGGCRLGDGSGVHVGRAAAVMRSNPDRFDGAR